jgi:signal transduction histidine kinase
MPSREPEISEKPVVSLSTLPATPQQRRLVFAVAVVLLAAFGITAPFARMQLPSYVSFNPSVESMVFVNDLITSILLFSQYSISRSRAILVLAIGYLYTALIVIPHVLAFPGAFAGLLVTGAQTSAWLYYFWTAGTPIAVMTYALFSNVDGPSGATEGAMWSVIGCSIALVICLVFGITWITTAGNQYLPSLMSGNQYSNAVIYIANPLAILVAAIALAMLWSRRRSVLDYWLMLVMFSLILNYVIAAFLATQRYSLGFYASRGFTLVTSMLVLALLLREMTNLYTHFARSNMMLERSNMMLERERKNKLMNVNAATSSIAHEVRQPLTAITTRTSAARRWLERVPPDVDRAKSLLGEIEGASFRASEILTNVRRLFQDADHELQPIDVNNLALEALQTLHGDLNDHGVKTDVELASELPLVMGHRVQLQEVVLNLVHNAIDAMVPVKIDRRVLKVRTKPDGSKTIIIEVEDSGRGIEPGRLGSIFEAFVTTKANGMGLGLAICSRIIERHGGHLTASSDGKSGALFQIVLPVEPTAIST